MALTFKPIIDGFEAYDGDRKIAVVRTRGHDGMSYDSAIKKRHFADNELPQNIQLRGEKEEVHLSRYTETPRDSWEIRFTGGSCSVADLKEIIDHDPSPHYAEAAGDRE
jgi:hypothetical protein